MTTAFRNFKAKLAFLWATVVLGCLAAFVWFVAAPPLQTGLLELIPQTESNPAVEAAYGQLTQKLEKQVVILVSASNPTTAIDAADRLATALRRHRDEISEVMCRVNENTQREFFETLFPVRWSVPSSTTSEYVTSKDFVSLGEQKTQRLYSMFSGMSSGLIDRDPLFLFEDVVTSQPRHFGDFLLEDGHLMLHQEKRHFVLMTVLGADAVFDADGGGRLVAILNHAIDSVKNKTGVAIHWTGMVKYAEKAARSAQWEVTIIGTGSLVGIVILMLTAFFRFRELFFGLIPIAVGLMVALATTTWVFGAIHVITLVFGASLVGVCIDYSFHFFAHHAAPNKTGWGVLKEILPGITLGMITSVVGYVALFIAPFPGIQQMSVFAAVGLVSAYVTVVLWFPFLPLQRKQELSTPRLWRWSTSYLKWIQKKQLRWVLVCSVPIAAAVPFLSVNDDVRLLRGDNQVLEAEESFISDKIHSFDKSRVIVLTGNSAEVLAQKEEKLAVQLEKVKSNKGISDYVTASQLAPSRKMQRQIRRFWVSFLKSDPGRQYLQHLSLTNEEMKKILHQAANSPFLKFEDVRKKEFAALYDLLRLGKVNGQNVSVVLLKDIKHESRLRNAARRVDGAMYVNKVAQVSDLFKRYRIFSSILVAFAYAVIFVFLVVRYGIKNGTLIIIPPLLAALWVLGTMAVLQINVTLFTFMGLLIVLAIGIDYTLFFAESNDTSPTGFAILLSGLTTILSFGLLALSDNPGLHSFGMTVLVGIFVAALLSPFSRIAKKKR